MDLKDCTQFANENPVCYLATAEGDQPRVRGLALWFADDTGFYFHTATSKSLYKQLEGNPKVELCMYAPGTPPDAGTMPRVAGQAELVQDIALKTRLLEERPFLAAIARGGAEDPLLAVFRVYTGEARFWTMGDNLREQDSEVVKF